MRKYKPNNQNQMTIFPLNLEDLISPDHLVRVVNTFVEQISNQVLEKPFAKEGKPPYEPKTMLKVLIYSYAIKLYSSRKIERALLQDVTYMWLSGMQTPDHNTINRFRSFYFKEIMEEVFTEMLDYLLINKYVRFETFFTDGTKIEANANKYSYVWARNTSRYKEQLKERIQSLFREIAELNNQEDTLYSKESLGEIGKDKQINSQELKQVAEKLNQQLKDKTGKQKRSFKSKINKIENEAEKLQKYEKQEEILSGRNSYSKTDHDATFMRNKQDQLLPNYNVIFSTEEQFITNFSISQNASDSAGYIEHINKIEERGDNYLPKNNVTDAGFGSEENYHKLEEKKIGNYLKYNTFYQDTKGGSKKPFHKDKFKYDSQKDCFYCPENQCLIFKTEGTQKTSTGYITTVRIYEGTKCRSCPKKAACTQAENRTIQKNECLDRYKVDAYKNLTSEQGIKFRKQRNIDVETVNADIKENMGYRKFRLRGKEKVNLEIGYLSIAHNMKKIKIKNLKRA
jgi:transposase